MMKDKFILDACCGGRMFWFDKEHPNCLYVDKRVIGDDNPEHKVKPDKVMDFRDMALQDSSFKLVVFDPPHIRRSWDNKGHIARDYGVLSPENWEQDIKKGFDECWRVLEDYGFLVFKWAETEVKVKDIINIIKTTPLFGHKTKRNTHWLCFIKIPDIKHKLEVE